MAADSRLTVNRTVPMGDKQLKQIAVGWTDTVSKLFCTPGGAGISTCGDAGIGKKPITGFIESFIRECLPISVPVDVIPGKLIDYFGKMEPVPNVQFHVAGYLVKEGIPEQQVWWVSVPVKAIERRNKPGECGASWSGEVEIVSRLVKRAQLLEPDGTVSAILSEAEIPWNFFTLQDAIDFAVFATRATIEAIRFLSRAKTVGGPIDILTIKPDGASWVQHKELHGEVSASEFRT